MRLSGELTTESGPETHNEGDGAENLGSQGEVQRCSFAFPGDGVPDIESRCTASCPVSTYYSGLRVSLCIHRAMSERKSTSAAYRRMETHPGRRAFQWTAATSETIEPARRVYASNQLPANLQTAQGSTNSTSPMPHSA
jgi:hypothetical protein